MPPARVVLDECVPRPLRRELPTFDVSTVAECGWAGMRNGALLRLLLDHGVVSFVTTDRNLEHQQSIARSGLAVVVLVARSNKLADLLPLVPELRLALETPTRGSVIHVGR